MLNIAQKFLRIDYSTDKNNAKALGYQYSYYAFMHSVCSNAAIIIQSLANTSML